MTTPLRVLHVEDSEADAALVAAELARVDRPVALERVETGPAMRALLQKEPWDVILSDWSLPEFSANAALTILEELDLDIPFVIVCGAIGEERAVEAMRAGARDVVSKEKLARLVPAIEREMREVEERRVRRGAEAELRWSEERYRALFEQSPIPKWVYDTETLRFLAVNDAAVRHYGFTRDEFLSMTIKEIRPSEDVAELLRTAPARDGIWRHRKKDGIGKHYLFMVRCRIPGGQLTAKQYLAVDDLAGKYANGTLRITSPAFALRSKNKSSASRRSSTDSSSASSPAATSCSKASPASPKLPPSTRSRAAPIAPSRASNSRPTSSLPTSPAR